MPRLITLHKTSQIGYRETNEDKEEYLINLSEDGGAMDPHYAPIDLFIVCDGHGGSEVSQYVCPRVKKLFSDSSLVYPIEDAIIFKMFDVIQKDIINHPKQIGQGCGSTCLVVIRYMKKTRSGLERSGLQVINIGDCRAVLSRNGIAQPLTKDHKPIWPEEKRRIDAVNKKYHTNQKIHYDFGDFRILDLSVSRAFGDLDAVPYLSHVPDIFVYALQPSDEFIIVACDGLWDVIQTHEAVNFIIDHITNNNIIYYQLQGYVPHDVKYKGKNNIAKRLADYAIARGSTDNVSVMIVFLLC